ncbi:hypothetical protein KBX50_04770 [Micromonospora sp. C51]|uniref:hypothetical protein n=1 Tax=Micromonospora sp. C51 TaxID=2824879 RepID=UPI001B398169|nr:hypothetical protein [Micromonospora sp. C51]MBQ1047802.1 hypothetical protein [Micromonospora sp. C51]
MAHRERNDALAAVIADSGLSYDGVARAVRQVARDDDNVHVNANRSTVAHWIAGSRPQPRTLGYLVEALRRCTGRPLSAADIGYPDAPSHPGLDDLPQDPIAAVVELGRSDLNRRALISSGIVYSLSALALPLDHRRELAHRSVSALDARAVGMSDVAAVRHIVTAFNDLDERLGGAHGRTTVVDYLSNDVMALCSAVFRNETARRAMLATAAQLAYLAGWKTHDAGHAQGVAQRYYLSAYQLADASGDPGHAGYCLRILANQANRLGRIGRCVDLAEAAKSLVRGRVDPATEAMFHLTLAEAHALAGNRRNALTSVWQAERLAGRATDEAPPAWMTVGGSRTARIASHIADTLVALGDHAGAERQLRAAVACWNPTTHPRVYSLTLSRLAETQCRRGHIDQACVTWSKALEGLAGIQSGRAATAVGTMRAALRPHRQRGVAAAVRLDARAATWRRQGARSAPPSGPN